LGGWSADFGCPPNRVGRGRHGPLAHGVGGRVPFGPSAPTSSIRKAPTHGRDKRSTDRAKLDADAAKNRPPLTTTDKTVPTLGGSVQDAIKAKVRP